ncbi:MAG: thioredoxin domain-containing protein, partial [Endozoicomonas sp.]
QFPVSSEPTVTELFSIYCGGCYRWEKKALGTLKENLAKRKIEFKQAHMFFMGKYGKQATTALAITQGTELYEPVKNALFTKIHVERTGDWKNDDDFFSTLSKAGLPRKAFEQQQNGPVALKSVLDWNRYSGNIDAVPSFLVNNRYLLKTGSIKSFDEMDQLIAWLAKLPAEAPSNPKTSDSAPENTHL